MLSFDCDLSKHVSSKDEIVENNVHNMDTLKHVFRELGDNDHTPRHKLLNLSCKSCMPM